MSHLFKLPVLLVFMLLSLSVTAQESSHRALENQLIDAVALLNDNKLAEAKAQLDALYEKDSLNDAVCYYRGVCSYNSSELAAAQKDFERAAALDTLNTAYADALAAVYSATHQDYQAIALYERLLKLNPSKYRTPYVLTLLGDRELNERRDSSALAHYDAALEYDPNYVPAILGKTEAYRMTGNIPAFFLGLNRFIEVEDVNASAKCHYVNELLKGVNQRFFNAWHAQIDSTVTACVRVHPSDSSCLKLAGQWFYGTGRKEEGTAFFDKWLQNYPEEVDANMTKLQLLATDKKWNEVIDQADAMFGLKKLTSDDRLTLYSIIGDSYHYLGERKKAYANYDKALKLNPEYVPVLNNYAYYLSLEGRKLDKAAAMSKITIEKEPDNPTYLDTYGWILYLQKKYSEAKPLFKHAMIYGGKDSGVILEHYARVLEALGENDLARYYMGISEGKEKE